MPAAGAEAWQLEEETSGLSAPLLWHSCCHPSPPLDIGFTQEHQTQLFCQLYVPSRCQTQLLPLFPPRFTSPPDASPHGKPWAVPSASLHAPRAAPAAAAARSDLLLPSWSDEFWESWLPLPPRSSASTTPSSSLFQHAGELPAPPPPAAHWAPWVRGRGCGAAELLCAGRLLTANLLSAWGGEQQRDCCPGCWGAGSVVVELRVEIFPNRTGSSAAGACELLHPLQGHA